MRACGLQLLDDGEQMADRAGEAIEPDHYKGLARADIAQQTRQDGPIAIGAGGVFFKNGGAAGCAQFVELRIGALFFGGDAGVADQTACNGGFSDFWRSHVGCAFAEAPVLQSNKVFVNGRLQRWPSVGDDKAGRSSGQGVCAHGAGAP